MRPQSNVWVAYVRLRSYGAKDLYGNRDLPQGEAAAALVEEALRKLAELPPEYAAFYRAKAVGQIRAAGGGV